MPSPPRVRRTPAPLLALVPDHRPDDEPPETAITRLHPARWSVFGPVAAGLVGPLAATTRRAGRRAEGPRG